MGRPASVNLVGQVFGRLTVIEFVDRTKAGDSRWKCTCECGNTRIAVNGDLKKGNVRSCGCLRSEVARKYDKDETRSTTYKTWDCMKQRCNNTNDKDYPNYGGRGIKICDEWKTDYLKFLEDMGERPAGMTIDRIDNNGPYCKANCKWATITEQNRNKRNVHRVVIDGEEMTLGELSDRTGIKERTLRHRLMTLRWPADKLTQPVDTRFYKKDKGN